MNSRRVVLVSGGAGAIGSDITRRLHREGCEVVIGYVSAAPAQALAAELSTEAAHVHASGLDLADLDGLRETIGALLTRHGRFDGVVFCGGSAPHDAVVDGDERAWQQCVRVNFVGPALVTRLCLPAMLVAGRGAVVAVTTEAVKTGDARHAPYAAAKAGLAGFLEWVTATHGSRGIRTGCVAPGPVDTPFLRSGFSSDEHAERAISHLRRLVPVGRLGTTDEVAESVAFLLSDRHALSGVHLSVGGGLSMS